MHLNTAIVSQKITIDLISRQPLVDPLSQNNLPWELLRIICEKLKQKLPTVALVCKNWKALADDKVFRKMIRPAITFGSEEWKEYIGVDVGNEPRLPRRAYGDLEKKGGRLTFIPDKVSVTEENGMIKEVPLDHLEAIGKLVSNPKKGNKTGYYNLAWPWNSVIQEKRDLQKPHWVWIKKKAIGNNKTYSEQQKLAKSSGANISGLIDTTITFFMEYVRWGTQNLVCDPTKYIRVNENTMGLRIILRFTPSGLLVNAINGFPNNAYKYIYIAIARESLDS